MSKRLVRLPSGLLLRCADTDRLVRYGCVGVRANCTHTMLHYQAATKTIASGYRKGTWNVLYSKDGVTCWQKDYSTFKRFIFTNPYGHVVNSHQTPEYINYNGVAATWYACDLGYGRRAWIVSYKPSEDKSTWHSIVERVSGSTVLTSIPWTSASVPVASHRVDYYHVTYRFYPASSNLVFSGLYTPRTCDTRIGAITVLGVHSRQYDGYPEEFNSEYLFSNSVPSGYHGFHYSCDLSGGSCSVVNYNGMAVEGIDIDEPGYVLFQAHPPSGTLFAKIPTSGWCDNLDNYPQSVWEFTTTATIEAYCAKDGVILCGSAGGQFYTIDSASGNLHSFGGSYADYIQGTYGGHFRARTNTTPIKEVLVNGSDGSLVYEYPPIAAYNDGCSAINLYPIVGETVGNLIGSSGYGLSDGSSSAIDESAFPRIADLNAIEAQLWP